MEDSPPRQHDEQKDVVLAGLGAQAKYALEIIRRHDPLQVELILDLEDNYHEEKIYDIPVEQYHEVKNQLLGEDFHWLICYSDNQRKRQLYEDLVSSDESFINAVHPEAFVAKTAELGTGNIINPNTVIQPYASVGNGCMIHTGSIVEHDCELESYVNLAPGATLAGHVTVRQEAYVYTNATVTPTCTVGERAEVGAGAVVIDNVDPKETVVGAPAEPVN